MRHRQVQDPLDLDWRAYQVARPTSTLGEVRVGRSRVRFPDLDDLERYDDDALEKLLQRAEYASKVWADAQAQRPLLVAMFGILIAYTALLLSREEALGLAGALPFLFVWVLLGVGLPKTFFNLIRSAPRLHALQVVAAAYDRELKRRCGQQPQTVAEPPRRGFAVGATAVGTAILVAVLRRR